MTWRRWRSLALSSLVLAAGCDRDLPTNPASRPMPEAPSFEISDAAHGSLQPGFYFLPPMVDAPTYSGTFDPALTPTVTVCALVPATAPASGYVCGEIIKQFSGSEGSSPVTVDLEKQSYSALWNTSTKKGAPELLVGPDHYRVEVSVGSLQLGYADLWFVERGKDLKKVMAGYVGAVAGSVLPIKFRIETGIPGSVTVAPSSASIVQEHTQTFTATVYDLHGAAMTCPHPIAWSSSMVSVATVAATGEATGVAPGTTTITAACLTVSGTAALEVTPKPLTWAHQYSGTSYDLYEVSGVSASSAFISGDQGTVLRWDGTSWTSIGTYTLGAHLWSLWEAGPTNVFVVGRYDVILHYLGSTWESMSNPTGVDNYAVWGLSGSDVFVGGPGGRIAHYDGTSWSLMASPTSNYIVGFWGATGSDVYAVGGLGQILHYDGTSWSFVRPSGSGPALGDIWGTSSTDIFAVGQSGVILHFDGTAWTSMTSGTTTNLRGVWGAASDDVYAVGEGGTILHYDGTSWTSMTSGTTARLNSIWGSSASDIVIAGDAGLILRGTR